MQNKGQLGMILGIVSIVLSVLAYIIPGGLSIVAIVVALACGILGIIFGVQGRKAGDSKGTAGLVTGIIGTVFAGITFACVGCAALCAMCVVNEVGNGLGELANELEALEGLY